MQIFFFNSVKQTTTKIFIVKYTSNYNFDLKKFSEKDFLSSLRTNCLHFQQIIKYIDEKRELYFTIQ